MTHIHRSYMDTRIYIVLTWTRFLESRHIFSHNVKTIHPINTISPQDMHGYVCYPFTVLTHFRWKRTYIVMFLGHPYLTYIVLAWKGPYVIYIVLAWKHKFDIWGVREKILEKRICTNFQKIIVARVKPYMSITKCR